MMMSSTPILLRQRRVWRGRRAFTLVELMVAVALVLVLIIGVNEVFRLTSNTINVGQSLSNATRDQRAVKTTLEEDFKAMAPDGPCLIITNKAVAAFRSREDELAQASLVDGAGINVGANPLYQDLNGDGYAIPPNGTLPPGVQFVTGEYANPATPNSRVRRVDTITFFVRRPGMARQTPNLVDALDPNGVPVARQVVGKAVADEAMVTYGHLRLPDNASIFSNAVYFEPGEPDGGVLGTGNKGTRKNDNNKYYTQWVLGRSAMLMSPENRLDDLSAFPFETHFAAPISDSTILTLTPLSMTTNAGSVNAGGNINGNLVGRGVRGYNATLPGVNWFQVGGTGSFRRGPYDSIIDVAGISMSDFSKRLADYVRDVEQSGAADYLNASANNGLWYLPAPSTAYSDTGNQNTALPRETLSYRFNGNPFGQRGFTGGRNDLALSLAQSAPVLAPRCTNFIVEFAGDFVTQNDVPQNLTAGGSIPTYGQVTAGVPDGEIDFVVFRGQRRIRWYGLPRYDNTGNQAFGTTGTSTYYGPIVRGRTAQQHNTLLNDNIVYGENIDTLPNNTLNVSEVVPVSDLLCDAKGANSPFFQRSEEGTIAKFEKVLMTNQTIPSTGDKYFYDLDAAGGRIGAASPTTVAYANSVPVQENYADPSSATTYTLQRANYVCAWQGNDQKPKLIRITMTLEDPNSRSGAGQTYEYVFPVK